MAGIALIIAAVILISGCAIVGINEDAKDGVSGSTVKDISGEAAERTAEETQEKEEKKEGFISGIVGRVVMHSDCKEVSLNLLEVDGEKELCLYKNTLSIGVLNDGEKPLSGIKLYIESEKSGEIETMVRSAISPGSAARHIVRYDTEKYGELEKVKIIPVIKADGKDIVCDEAGIKGIGLTSCG